MKSVKIIIFIVGLFLINFVGGIPQDSRNLFISHTIYFAPILLEYYPLLKIETFMKWPVKIIWGAGIIVLISNILGIAGIIHIARDAYNVIFNEEYYTFFNLSLHVNTYLLIVSLVYASIFVGTLTLYNQLNVKLVKEKSKKSGRELQKHVHS